MYYGPAHKCADDSREAFGRMRIQKTKKSPVPPGFFEVDLFGVGNTAHFADDRDFDLARILHVALNFL